MDKKLIFGSLGAAGLVALAAILDMAIAVPFGRYSMALDIMYLVAAGMVIYMGVETFREIR